MMNNYFLSMCISNLGVEPCLIRRFLRFLPNFVLLFALLLRVTLVLETILSLLKTCFLYLIIHFVKILIFLFCLPTFADSKDIIMAKGEHRELKLAKLRRYTVGNREIISYKHLAKKETIIIKGKKMGFTQLIIWGHNEIKKSYNIYVLSKNNHLKMLHLVETLKRLKLKTTSAGLIIIAEGEIKYLKDLELINKLIKENPKRLHIKATLSSKLKSKLLGDIYKVFFNNYIDYIRCSISYYQILCYYPNNSNISKQVINHLKTKYNVQLIPIPIINNSSNFYVKLKLIKIEDVKGKEIQWGLEQISGSLEELFNKNIISIIKKNKLLLKNENIHFKTMAQPQMIIMPDVDTTIDIGSEIAYNSDSNNQSTITKWKFIGLKLKLKLKKTGKKYIMEFKNDFFRANTNNLSTSGNRQQSSLIIELNKPIKLFEIGFEDINNKSTKLPLISKIPLLSKLVGSKINNKVYKKIIGIIKLEKIK